MNPPRPLNYEVLPPPGDYAQLRRLYGNPDNADRFEREYIVSRPHELSNGSTIHVRSHIAIADRISRVFAALKASGHLSQIKTYDGCFNIRKVRGGAALSLHSWGLAVDVNAAEFPLGSHAHQPPELVAAFARENMLCGEAFRHRCDAMHFEFCRVLF